MQFIVNEFGEYWNNDFGWVDMDSATIFTDEAKKTMNLPIEGRWKEIPKKPETQKEKFEIEKQTTLLSRWIVEWIEIRAYNDHHSCGVDGVYGVARSMLSELEEAQRNFLNANS